MSAERHVFAAADVLERIHQLELEARSISEGYLAGRHRSDRHGFAIEFAQHREYTPGDDFKHIDWKVFGRTDRFYLKQHELETNFLAWLVIDESESMRFRSGSRSKYDLACIAGLALSQLILDQGDMVGLAKVDSELTEVLRPSSQPSRAREIARQLAEGPTERSTDLGTALHSFAGRLQQRGLCLIFSDLFDDPESLLAGLRHLKYARQEVVVFQTLDVAEVEFTFRGPTLFRGLERLPELLTDPHAIRDSYLEEFERFRAQIRDGCRRLEIDLVELRTDMDLGLTLARYLTRRFRGRARARVTR